MKPLGIILVVAGILMLIFTNINFTTEEKVVDLGPLEVNKKENKSISWPTWAGGVAVIAGIVLIVTDKKKVI
jgi:hypothetical protein